MPKLIKPRRKVPDNLLVEQLLSIPRIAELEDCSEETIWRDIRAGRLKAVWLSPKRVRIRISDWKAARGLGKSEGTAA